MIKYHYDIAQGTEEWLHARLGLITASTMNTVLTPKLKIAANAESRMVVYNIIAERLTGEIEPHYQSDTMLAGHIWEEYAKKAYSKKHEPVHDCGFITNDKWGFTIGYSPDGLVGEEGLVECKARISKLQIKTVVEGGVPEEFMLQCQTALLVTERKYIDFLSYSNGLHMLKETIEPIPEYFDKIIEASEKTEKDIAEKMEIYKEKVMSVEKFTPTEHKDINEQLEIMKFGGITA